MTDQQIHFRKNKLLLRGRSCVENMDQEEIPTVREEDLGPLPLSDIEVGPIDEEQKQRLLDLLNQNRDCLALSTSELACSKMAEIKIHLCNHAPLFYRPYRMSITEQEVTKKS
ncbi:uncharacterized protein LOC143193741 [Rhynchophorus ferrugineus]